MNKIFTLLAATTLFAGAAFAQDAPTIVSSVTFNVSGQVQALDEEGAKIDNCWVLPSVDATVTITLDGYNSELAMDGGWTPYIVWTKGTGYAIDQDFEEPTPIVGQADTYGFTLNKEKWGNPSGGNFYVTVMLCFVNADFDFLMNADEEPVMFDVSYVTPNVFPAEFLYAYPNGAWEDGDTFAKAYKPNGEGCRFNFNNTVDFTVDAPMGEIVYFLGDGLEEYADIILQNVNDTEEGVNPAGKATVGFNPLDGNYVVSVPFYNSEIDGANIESIEITLTGMRSKGVAIPNETATITNNTAAPTVQKIKKNRLTESLVDANAPVDVYNIQGMLVKANADKSTLQNLPAGLYIVDGKKVVIR